MDDDTSDTEQNFRISGNSATISCIQYLISHHMKCLSVIKKEDLMQTVFKGLNIGKNYERIIQDVAITLQNVFGFNISYIKNDTKQFIIVNDLEDIGIPLKCHSSRESSKYRVLLFPIIVSLVMLRQPISEGQMWKMMEKFAQKFNLDMNIIKTVVKKDFVKDLYLQYKPTDDTTIMWDPDKTSYWFSMGPRSLIECNQLTALQQVGKLYNLPAKSFKLVYADVFKN